MNKQILEEMGKETGINRRELAMLSQSLDTYLVDIPESEVEIGTANVSRGSLSTLLIRIVLRWLVRVVLALSFLALLGFLLWLRWH